MYCSKFLILLFVRNKCDSFYAVKALYCCVFFTRILKFPFSFYTYSWLFISTALSSWTVKSRQKKSIEKWHMKWVFFWETIPDTSNVFHSTLFQNWYSLSSADQGHVSLKGFHSEHFKRLCDESFTCLQGSQCGLFRQRILKSISL